MRQRSSRPSASGKSTAVSGLPAILPYAGWRVATVMARVDDVAAMDDLTLLVMRVRGG